MGEDPDDEGVTTARTWQGIPAGRALEWTRVLRTHWPDWPGVPAIRRVSAGLRVGRPADLPAWARRARLAEAAGFDPLRYERLQTALDAVPAVEHPAHPDNEPDPRWPVHLIRPFDTAVWADWPWLVAAGWTDEEAVRLLLTARDLPPA